MARPYLQHQGPETSAPRMPTSQELRRMDATFKAQALSAARRPSRATKAEEADEEADEEAEEAEEADEEESPADVANPDSKEVPKHGAEKQPSIPLKTSGSLQISGSTEAKRQTSKSQLETLQLTSTAFFSSSSLSSLVPSLEHRTNSYRHGLLYTSFIWCLWDLCDDSTIINLNHHLVETYITHGYDTAESLAPLLRDSYRTVTRQLKTQSKGKNQSRIVYLLRWFSAVMRPTYSSILEYLRGESLAWLRVEKHIGWGESTAFRCDFIRQQLTNEDGRTIRQLV